MFVESYWTYHIQTLMGGPFRFQGWPVTAPPPLWPRPPSLAPPLADRQKQTDRERWIVNSRGSEEAEKCASDVNSQASARAEINSAALPSPTGTDAAQIRWLCAVMNLPENLICASQSAYLSFPRSSILGWTGSCSGAPSWRPSQSSYLCIEERGSRIEEGSLRSDNRGYTRAASTEVFYRPTRPLIGYQLLIGRCADRDWSDNFTSQHRWSFIPEWRQITD